jgi:hypothetical protein
MQHVHYIHTDDEQDTPRTRQDPLAHTRLSLKSIQKKSSQQVQQDGSLNRLAEDECESPLQPTKDILAGTRLDRNSSPPSRLKSPSPSMAAAKRSETASGPVKGEHAPVSDGKATIFEQNQNKKESQGLREGPEGASGHLVQDCVAVNTAAPKRNSGGFIARLFDFNLCANSRRAKADDDAKSHKEGKDKDESQSHKEKETKSQEACPTAAVVVTCNTEKDAWSSNPRACTMTTATHAHVASSPATRGGMDNTDQSQLQHQPCAHGETWQGNPKDVPLWQIQNGAEAAHEAISRVSGDLLGMFQCGKDGRDTARSHVSVTMGNNHDDNSDKLPAPDKDVTNQRDRQQHYTEHLCSCLGFTLGKSPRKLCHVIHAMVIRGRKHQYMHVPIVVRATS